MKNESEITNNGQKSLKNIFKKSESLDNEFGEIMWQNISHFFPEGFDKTILKLNEILSGMKYREKYSIRRFTACEINIGKYTYGNIVELYNKIKEMNGFIIDGFKIDVTPHNFNLNNNREGFIIIKFTKIDDIIEIKPKIGKLCSVQDKIDNIIPIN